MIFNRKKHPRRPQLPSDVIDKPVRRLVHTVVYKQKLNQYIDALKLYEKHIDELIEQTTFELDKFNNKPSLSKLRKFKTFKPNFSREISVVTFLPSEIRIVESFLTGRLQQVSVNGVQSEWIELKEGVAQGTVVGPLFFNLYMNDLPKLVSEAAHILQYADDCLIFCSNKKFETSLEVLQDNLFKLEEYVCLNKLNLKENKTEFITSSLKNDKRLNGLETVILGSTIVKKSPMPIPRCNH